MTHVLVKTSTGGRSTEVYHLFADDSDPDDPEPKCGVYTRNCWRVVPQSDAEDREELSCCKTCSGEHNRSTKSDDAFRYYNAAVEAGRADE